LVERNTTIPTKKTETFSTADDNQKAVTVQIYQGERPMAADNRLLAKFDLVDIEQAPRGQPKIEVSFDIDANGILNVSAKDLKTGKEVKRQIETSSGISKEDVEKMKRDADSHADEDKKKKELADARNEADQASWQVEKLLKDNEGKISDADKSPLQSAVDAVKKAKEGTDVDAIKLAVNNLHTAAHAMSQHLGRGAGGPPPDGAQPSGGGGKDDVIDAEFEVKK
ncbi:MAG: Hsp70 family protein, partial [Planctomycetota bacterium]